MSIIDAEELTKSQQNLNQYLYIIQDYTNSLQKPKSFGRMTEILPVQYSEHRVGPKLQETRLKGHWLQDDTDSQEFDKLLAELHSFSEDHSVKGFYQDGYSLGCDDNCTNDDQKCEDGTEAGKYSYTHSEMSINVKMLNNSQLGKKQLESKVKNMPVAENIDKNKNVQHSRPLVYNSQKPKQGMLSLNKIENQIVGSEHSNSSVQESKLQAYITNSAKSKPQAPGISSSLVNDAHSGKHAVVSGSAASAAALSLAELAKQHRSHRSKVASVREVIPASKASAEGLARVSFTTFHPRDQPAACVVGSFTNCSDSFVGSFESPNEKLGKEYAKSTPVVLGCSLSTGSLKELPAVSSQRAGPSSGMSLSQLALQHKQSKSPLLSVTPRNGCKPSLLQLMKNVAIDDMRTSTPAEAPGSKVPSKEPVASLSLTLCLKLNKASDTFTKLPGGQQNLDTEDMDVSNTFMLMESQSDQPGAESQEQEIPTDLIPQVSSIGLVLCCLKRKRKLEGSPSNMGKTLKYPKFECHIQVGNRKVYPEIAYRKIQPFDFSTPSPDDIVKHKQKQAFTRPQKEFEF